MQRSLSVCRYSGKCIEAPVLLFHPHLHKKPPNFFEGFKVMRFVFQASQPLPRRFSGTILSEGIPALRLRVSLGVKPNFLFSRIL